MAWAGGSIIIARVQRRSRRVGRFRVVTRRGPKGLLHSRPGAGPSRSISLNSINGKLEATVWVLADACLDRSGLAIELGPRDAPRLIHRHLATSTGNTPSELPRTPHARTPPCTPIEGAVRAAAMATKIWVGGLPRYVHAPSGRAPMAAIRSIPGTACRLTLHNGQTKSITQGPPGA